MRMAMHIMVAVQHFIMVIEEHRPYDDIMDDGRLWGSASHHPMCTCDGQHEQDIVKKCRTYRKNLAETLWRDDFVPKSKNPKNRKTGTPSHKPPMTWMDSDDEGAVDSEEYEDDE